MTKIASGMYVNKLKNQKTITLTFHLKNVSHSPT